MVRSAKNISKEHLRILGIISVYIAVAMLASYVYYLRYPNNYKYPNFYAEDVQYVQNIHDHGFWRAIATPFNGYPIVGVYLLQGIAILFNHGLYDGGLLTLPRSISIVSYLAVGWVAALPILLLGKLLRPVMLAWLIAATLFVPLPLYDHAVLGNTANLKFLALYVAVMLIVSRHIMPHQSKLIWIIDLSILICCFTNVVVCGLVPFMALKYSYVLKRQNKLKILFKDQSFISYAILVGCLGLLALYVASHHVFQDIGSIYARPYRWPSTVEIFIARSYLAGFLYGIYPLLTNVVTILLMSVCILIVCKYALRKFLFAIALCTISIVGATFLYIYGRPGLSSQYYNYRSSGFDQYFYAQNLIAYLIVALAVSSLLITVRSRYLQILIALVPFLLFIQIPRSGTFGANNYMAEQGSILVSASVACRTQTTPKVTFATYPDLNPLWNFTAERNEVCTPQTATTFNDPLILGLRADGNGSEISEPGVVNHFTQTFTIPAPNLKGILLSFDTGLYPVKDAYRFTLMDTSCNKILYSQTLNTMFFDAHYPVRFRGLNDLRSGVYCFSVTIKDHRQPTQQLGIPLTRPGSYTKGQLTINGRHSNQSVVFGYIY